MKKLTIYTDLDGTALTDWDLGPEVPARSLAAIRAFTEAGGCFSAASGRQAPDILALFPGVEFSAPLVCSNGAVVYDPVERRVLRRIGLPKEYKKVSAELFLKRPDVWIVAADERAIYQVMSGDRAKDEALTDWVRPPVTLEEYLERDFVKMVYILREGGDMEALKETVEALPGAELVRGVQSGPWYLEMIERSVSKSDGIRFALEAAGLRDRTLVCIGDYYNDWDMLKAADIAACPGNAPQDIRDICRIVTCGNNEGALADLIDRLR